MACICSRATNLGFDEDYTYRYIDCEGNIDYYPVLAPGETGPKICLSEWLGTFPLEAIEYFGDCSNGICPTPACYTLFSCDGSIDSFNTTTDLSLYENLTIAIDEFPETCFWVISNPSSECLEPLNVTISEVQPICNCALTCYSVDNGYITYINSEGQLINTIGPAEFCSNIYPNVDSLLPFTIVNNGLCINNQCSTGCYILNDCLGLADSIYTQSLSVAQYAGTGEAFKINGYTNCWTAEISEECDCAKDVVITTHYEDCEACMGYTSYKLSDCANASNIIYTSTDLSDYVNQIVEIDCPGCWHVEEFNLQPPTDLPVVVSNVFIDCQTCEQEYWRLTDCAGIEEDIITITDLSLYQDKVITLTWCPKICWSITSTRETTNSTIVFVENEYDLCLDCITDVNPCICSTITNLSDTSQVFSYFDCGGKEQRTSSLKPGQISDKFCARKINAPENYIIQYGECSIINGNDYKCPTVPLPKRTVTPGYNTPACTTEYFDKVSCAYAEVMYSIALEQRYGITSCCAEELEKWEIKYELLMMAAILDPDYVCTPSSTCCDPGLPKSTGTCNS